MPAGPARAGAFPVKPGAMHEIRRSELERLRNGGCLLPPGAQNRDAELIIWNYQHGDRPSLYLFTELLRARRPRVGLLQRVRLWWLWW